MLERTSALPGIEAFANPSVRITEDRGFTLLQLSGIKPAATEVIGKLPAEVGTALDTNGRSLMKVGRSQYWLVSGAGDDVSDRLAQRAVIVPLSHSRTRIRLEGEGARAVLARSAALDFHPSVFRPGMFALTGIHHTPVLIHCIGEQDFHVYAMRTFGLSTWEWLTDAALAV